MRCGLNFSTLPKPKPLLKQRWVLAMGSAVLCTTLLLVASLMPASGGGVIVDETIPLASEPTSFGQASTAPPINSKAVVRMNKSYLLNFNMTLETWTEIIGEQAYENEDGSVTVLLSQPSRDQLLGWYGEAVDNRIEAILTEPDTSGLFSAITCTDDLTELTLTLADDTYEQSHYLSIWRLQKLCYRYVLFGGDPSPLIQTTVRYPDGQVFAVARFPQDPEELSPGPGEDPLFGAVTGGSAQGENEITFEQSFAFDGLQLTFQDNLVWDVVDNPSGPLDGKDAFKIPVSAINLTDQPHGPDALHYTITGPGGNQLDDVNSFFRHNIDSAEPPAPGGEVIAYLCFLYDGDGDYLLELGNDKETVQVVLSIQKEI